MSGRQYEWNKGVPICNECGNYALRSEETNWNGNYCPHCKSFVFCDKFDETHPTWMQWIEYLKERAELSPFVDFTYGFKEFKKEFNKTV